MQAAENAKQPARCSAVHILEQEVKCYFAQAGAPGVARDLGYQFLEHDCRVAAHDLLKNLKPDPATFCWGGGSSQWLSDILKQWFSHVNRCTLQLGAADLCSTGKPMLATLTGPAETSEHCFGQ